MDANLVEQIFIGLWILGMATSLGLLVRAYIQMEKARKSLK